ncbi:methyltransferase family protein [Nitrosomonas communis]|uniref:Methyltransferase family protein n=1 Tax=Nitrosomonas communis TaxID=44574 RepID=A0A5D3Y7J9_9PROT|nr:MULTISPECIES: methyltransferase domain-containing protein [Nitrosomonas]TYP78357.1 methyltransferase family protein [Nitrosomonas communis]UVS62897.1 class I SAM-dependent methyltransferase [Nitrosomonas sp. PLL12]
MTPADYDAWYGDLRGSWIGHTEYRLMLRELAFPAEDRLLDAGCGTGWFTRRLATLPNLHVIGIDLDVESLRSYVATTLIQPTFRPMRWHCRLPTQFRLCTFDCRSVFHLRLAQGSIRNCAGDTQAICHWFAKSAQPVMALQGALC